MRDMPDKWLPHYVIRLTEGEFRALVEMFINSPVELGLPLPVKRHQREMLAGIQVAINAAEKTPGELR